MKKAFNYKRRVLLFAPLVLALTRVIYATEGEVDPSSTTAKTVVQVFVGITPR